MRRNTATQRFVPGRASARSLKPAVEGVERRVLLSAFTVTNTNDDNATGSLRWAIGQSNATAGPNAISFNIAGAGVHTIAITSPLPAVTKPVTIDGTTQPGYTTTPLIELNGSGAGASTDGLDVSAGNSTIKGLAIDRFKGEGISLSVAGSNKVQDDFIGTDPSGTVAEGNGKDGVLVLVNSNNNTIQGNLISANIDNGIYLNGQLFGANNPVTSGNLVIGNAIGTDVTGTIAMGNTNDGVYVQNAPMSTIGGTTASARNIISGNGNGLELYDNSDGSIIEGNYIGADVSGELPLGNGNANQLFKDGIVLRGISNSTIGGTAAGAGNVISANGNYGIDSFVIGSGNLAILGNLIGTDATGTHALGNHASGIFIWGESNVTIGGTVSGARNVISGNTLEGINTFADGPGLTIQGNYIGTDITGALPLGNGGDGINATFTGVTIGGLGAGQGNVIANNGDTAAFDHSGVRISSPGVSALSNSIYNNKLLGIDLANASTPVAPVLTSAVSMGTSSAIVGTLTTAPGVYTLQFFSTPTLNSSGNAEGETLLGTSTVTVVGASAGFTVTLPSGFTPGSLITATATDPVGGTSQFSRGIAGTGIGNGLGPPTITGVGSSPAVLAGQDVTDTFTITNPFMGADGGVVFSDPIPAGTTFASGMTSTGVPVTLSGGVATAAIGTLAAGESVTVTVVLTTSAAAVPSVTNVGGVVASTPPVLAGTDTASVTTLVDPSADLAITLGGPSGATLVGRNLTYLVTVTNNGPSDATGVTFADTLPAGVAFVSATPSGGPAPVLANGVLTDTYGALAAGASVTLRIVVTAGPGSAPLATDLASVVADQGDVDPTNNSASITSDITPVADVSVAITSPSPAAGVGVGRPLIYIVTVSNRGPSPASGVILSDVLPSAVTFASATSDVGEAPTLSGGTVTEVIGNLAAGASVVVTILVTPTASAPPAVVDAASILSNEEDPVPANDAASLATPVFGLADLAIVSDAVSPGSVAQGRPVVFTIVVSNNGPSTATNVVLADILPAGLTFLAGSADGGAVTALGGVVSAPVGFLLGGGTSTITIVATGSSVGTFSDRSTASSATVDPFPANNTASTSVVITSESDLSIVLNGPSGSVFTGDVQAYTAVITNNGPSSATNVLFSDTLMPGVAFAGVEANGVGGSESGGVVTQPLGTLAAGASVTVVLLVVPTLPGVVVNAASVASDVPDPDPANNASGVATAVIATYRLVEFAVPGYATTEDSGVAAITINRLGDPTGDVSVRFSTVAGGDATPGVDYLPASYAVDFPAGVTQRTVYVAVLPDPYDNHSEVVRLQLDSPAGGAILELGQGDGTAPTSALLTIVDVDPVLVGPAVTDLKLSGPANAITSIELDTTGNLDPLAATFAPNYTITALGGAGKAGLRAGVVVPVALASYNAATGAVILTLASPLPANELFLVDVNGTRPGAVADRAGNPLNSLLGVTPGSDYLLTVARGSNISYQDEGGTAVTLKLSGPGTIDLDRSVAGQVERLQVVGGVARKTVLSGVVHSKGRRTTIRSILGLGQFGSIQVKLTTPPFFVANTVYPNVRTQVDAPAVDTLIPPPPAPARPSKKAAQVVKAKAVVSTAKHPHAATAHALGTHHGR